MRPFSPDPLTCAMLIPFSSAIFLAKGEDWNLPTMKGVEFVKSVRGQQDGGHPVILFATTENDATEVAHAMAAGANEYVMKPFDSFAVRNKLAEIGVRV